MSRGDGGPAYPGKVRKEYPGGDNGLPPVFVDHPGMTLRDWFAGQAINGLMSESHPDGLLAMTVLASGGNHIMAITAAAYEIADAMLAERSK